MDYKKTTLFQNTLALKNDEYEPMRESLRGSYLKARDNAVYLLEQIRKDFPNLTIHDITHVDSLWDVASVIIGSNYYINPLEGFVLGCAFLIHDAALSYESVGGITVLRSTNEWKDYMFELSSRNDLSIEEKEKEADFSAIRTLHARYAESLMGVIFKRLNGSSFYILEDDYLRENLGQLIGEIAASHHWDIDRVSLLPTQINAIPGFPREWRINPLKLACIIRCADAGHIDAGRAPDFLFRILRINGVSLDHWKAQNRLAIVDIDQNDPSFAVITSMRDFCEEDFSAWNVAFDAIRVFNNEIKASNSLLEKKTPNSTFQIKAVRGANSKEELAKYIRTKGWEPCESNIHIDDVCGIISKLGGEALYGRGDHILIAIRELIQNARDSIYARHYLEPQFAGNGVIKIHVITKHNGTSIEISDNGIGMSEEVIKNCLLNFGESYWASQLSKKEFPGLRSSSFRPVGHYGIGFFAVFMVAKSVFVESRRFSASLDDNVLIKFPNGLTLSPIKSKIKGRGSDISTVVSFMIDETKYNWTGEYQVARNQQGESPLQVRFSDTIKAICAGLDVDVIYYENENPQKRIHQNIKDSDFDKRQWLRDISFADCQNDEILDMFIEKNYSKLEKIESDGRFIGLAALSLTCSSKQDFLSITTVGGLATSIHARSGEYYIGLFNSQSSTANRHGINVMQAYPNVMQSWAKKQFDSIKSSLNFLQKLYLQHSLCHFNVDPIDICSATLFSPKYGFINCSISELLSLLSNGSRLMLVLSSFAENRIETYADLRLIGLNLEDNDLYFHPTRNSDFLKVDLHCLGDDISFYGCLIRKLRDCRFEFNIELVPNKIYCSFGPNDVVYISKK